MLRTVSQLASLLTGVALLLLGTGLLSTLIPVLGGAMGFSSTLLGAMTSAYFAGFLGGTYLIPKLIRRTGHIRAFAFCATGCACLVLLLSLTLNPWGWLVLRFGIGVTLVGLYTVIESWLNSQALPEQRSSVFATYMVVNLGSLALAQQFLQFHPANQGTLFVIVTLLVCASTLPVLATRMRQPDVQPSPRLRLKRLFELAPSAGYGALVSGLAMGALWGLTPVYAASIGLDQSHIGTYMSIGIIGGAALQWPLGRLSDKHDRRIMLVLVNAIGAMVAIVMPWLAPIPWAQEFAFFVFGGMAFAVYPIVVAHLLDHVPGEELLAASSSVLLANGIGSALGPLAAGYIMHWLGAGALFGWFALCMGSTAIYVAFRYMTFHREQSAASGFVPMLRTTPTALEMHPGVDTETVTEASTS
ncbi:MFS transporter [Oleiagrimonas sp.]|jgi:MFS family permease|uniref:MFS transporter n=1 Tax=Oleiagrimonas sp. TaxID=2010330 RepID=UPI0026161AC9|nr:MFS transporter [Oleiagrimonas sp.]MDA3913572.1 MFS transporter [Oleiagrimonas sp.]